MDFTANQYAVIEKLEHGLNYWNLPEEEREIVRYLDRCGISSPRVDLAEGFYLLSESGKQVLEDHRRKIRSAKIETKRQLQEIQDRADEKQERRQRELDEAKKIACNEAKQEEQKRFENKIAIANLLVPIVTYILGLLTEHFAGILGFFLRLFD